MDVGAGPAGVPGPVTSAGMGRLVLVAFGCVYFFWGSTYAGIHVAGEHLAPVLVVATRSVITTVLLIGICLATGRSLRVTRGEAWRLALVGVLFMTANNVLLTWAETMVPTGISSLLVATMPVMVAVMEAALPGGERMRWRGWVGVGLATAGMVALVWPAFHTEAAALHPGDAALGQGVFAGGHGIPAGGRQMFAYGLLLVAAFAFAVGAVLSRRFAFTRDSFVVTTWEIGAAGVVNVLIATVGGTLHTAVWTRAGLGAIVYLSVFGSLVGLTSLSYLLAHVPVTKVTTYAFVNPVVAVLLGVVLLGERLSGAEVVGMATIVVAVALVIFSKVGQGGGQVVVGDPTVE